MNKKKITENWTELNLNWTELITTVCRNTCAVCVNCRSITLRARAHIRTRRTRVNSGEEFKDLSTFSPPVYYAPQYDEIVQLNNKKKKTHEKFYGKCVFVCVSVRFAHWPLKATNKWSEKDLGNNLLQWEIDLFVCFFLLILFVFIKLIFSPFAFSNYKNNSVCGSI